MVLQSGVDDLFRDRTSTENELKTKRMHIQQRKLISVNFCDKSNVHCRSIGYVCNLFNINRMRTRQSTLRQLQQN